MTVTFKFKRGTGSDPGASSMTVGEPVLRTDTAELFFKKDDGSVAKVSGGGGGGPDFKYLVLRNAANNGAASYPAADFTLVTSGTTSAVSPAAASALLVVYAGVIQQPNTGTSTPSSGFAISGSTIKFGSNIAAAPDFIIYQESGGIGEPSDNTVTTVKIVNDAVTADKLANSINSEIAANTAKTTNATHSGEVTGSGALTIASNVVDEDNLKVSNSPTNGYFLSAQSGNTGGLTWAAIPAGVGGATGVDFNDDVKARWGTDNDVSIYHDGSHAYMDNSTGDILLRVGSSGTTNGLYIENSGPTFLYHSGTYKAKTDGAGFIVSGTCTATTFSGSGASLTALPAGQLTGTVAAARLDTATTQSAGNNSTKIATTAYTDTAISNLIDSSPSALNTLNELAAALGDDANFSTTVTNSIATKLPLAGGTLTGTLTGKKLVLTDDGSTDPILQVLTDDQGVNIFHARNDTYSTDSNVGLKIWQENGGEVTIQNRGNGAWEGIDIQQHSGSAVETRILMTANRTVELYNQGSKHFETTSTGAHVTSHLGVATSTSVGTSTLQNASVASFKGSTLNQVNIAHSGNSSWGLLLTNSANSNSNYHRATNGQAACAIVVVASESLHFATGNQARWSVHHNGHFLPDSNNTYDIGSTSYRVRNLYINDLQLSNEGHSNSVDGTWGDWTLQEGEEDIFMINNRSGKKYKMALQEVS